MIEARSRVSQRLVDFLTPASFVRAAKASHPAFRFALAAAGLLAIVVIFVRFGVGRFTLIFGAVTLIGLMVLFLLFAQAAKLARSTLDSPAKVLVWAFLTIAISVVVLVAGSVFFNWPLPLRDWIVAGLPKNTNPIVHSESASSTPTGRTENDPNAPVFHADVVSHRVSRSLVPMTTQMRRLMVVDRKTADGYIYDDIKAVVPLDKTPNIEKLNREMGKGLTLDSFALNANVSCFVPDEVYYELRKGHPLPGWMPDGDCKEKSDLLKDPVFDIVVTNHTEETLVLTGIKLFQIDVGHVGGDEQPRSISPMLSVAARYNVRVSRGDNRIYRQDVQPPLQLEPHKPQRFQVRLTSRELCEDGPGYCEIYGLLRLGFDFGEDRSLVTDQFEIDF